MKKVASLLKGRFENIITYLPHPITNATSESINAKIQWVKYTARGFRDKQNFLVQLVDLLVEQPTVLQRHLQQPPCF
jgi:transposase